MSGERGARPGCAAERGVAYLVGAGPGDPDLITRRALDLLRTAEVVLHDELVHPALLAEVRRDAVVQYVGKRGTDPASKQTAQSLIDRELVRHTRAGRSVVRLKGGDPFLFGRGSEEAETLAREGLRFEIVPGVPSPLGATAYAGISLTHRDFASSVTFVSGTTRHGEPFDFGELRGVSGTMCVLMGMRRLEHVVAAMIETAGRAPETPAAVIQWGTRSEQRVVEAPLSRLAERARAEGLGSPAIIVIGAVASLRRELGWFDARPLFGKRVLVARAKEQAEATAHLLRRRGAEPVVVPLLSIEAPSDAERVRRAARELGSYDLVAFTSDNAVRFLFRAMDEEGEDARAFGRARVAAVGPGTAAALLERGVRADLVPASYVGEALADAILAEPSVAARLAKGEAPRVLVPRAKVAREALPEALRARGADVDVVPVYETKPAAVDRAELRAMFERGALDAVLVTSSSTVDHLVEALGEGAPALLGRTCVASIGPATTATATARGVPVALTADESTLEALVRAVEQHFAP